MGDPHMVTVEEAVSMLKGHVQEFLEEMKSLAAEINQQAARLEKLKKLTSPPAPQSPA
jgi:type II secretory pathway component PulM